MKVLIDFKRTLRFNGQNKVKKICNLQKLLKIFEWTLFYSK